MMPDPNDPRYHMTDLERAAYNGLTEARELGANQFDLRDAAQHSNVTTTSRYVRGRSEASGKIVKLRQEKRK